MVRDDVFLHPPVEGNVATEALAGGDGNDGNFYWVLHHGLCRVSDVIISFNPHRKPPVTGTITVPTLWMMETEAQRA